jgi:hypothetical protein
MNTKLLHYVKEQQNGEDVIALQANVIKNLHRPTLLN